MQLLPPRIATAIAEHMAPKEEILWTGRPIPKHAWTMVGTTYPRTRFLRAMSMVVFELCGWWILEIGMILGVAFFAMLADFKWTVPEFIGLVLLGPAAFMVIGGGCQAMLMPWRAVRWARGAHYVLTTHQGLVVTDNGGNDLPVYCMNLARVYPPSVYRLSSAGVGDVIFDASVREVVGDGDITTAWNDLGFYAVANAKRVAQKVEQARAARHEQVYLDAEGSWHEEPDR